jgi:hypothetical protein
MFYPCLDQCSQMRTALTTNSSPKPFFLYRRRVQHDTNGSTERLGGKGRGELGADDAGVSCRDTLDDCSCRRSTGRILFTVWSGDLAPDHADLGTADLLLAPVDESNLLAEIEAIMNVSIQTDWEHSSHVDVLGGVGVINTLNLDQAGSRAGGVTRALVAQVTSPKPSSSVQSSIARCVRALASRNIDIENLKSAHLSRQVQLSHIACVPGWLTGGVTHLTYTIGKVSNRFTDIQISKFASRAELVRSSLLWRTG